MTDEVPTDAERQSSALALSTAVLLWTLMGGLRDKGVFSTEELCETVDRSLLNLESVQAALSQHASVTKEGRRYLEILIDRLRATA